MVYSMSKYINPFAAANASRQPRPGATDASAQPQPGAKAALRQYFDLFSKKPIFSPKMMLGT